MQFSFRRFWMWFVFIFFLYLNIFFFFKGFGYLSWKFRIINFPVFIRSPLILKSRNCILNWKIVKPHYFWDLIAKSIQWELHWNISYIIYLFDKWNLLCIKSKKKKNFYYYKIILEYWLIYVFTWIIQLELNIQRIQKLL